MVRLLLERGARWKPEKAELNSAGRVLRLVEPVVTIELLTLLREHNACDERTVQQLLRVRRMRQHLAPYEQHLGRIGLTLEGDRPATADRVQAARPPSAVVLATYDRDITVRRSLDGTDVQARAAVRHPDVRLAKVCRQLQIPKPPRGYWAKKAAGRRVPGRPTLRPWSTTPAEVPRRRHSTLMDKT